MKTELTAKELEELKRCTKAKDVPFSDYYRRILAVLNTLEPAPEPEPKFSETVRAGDVYCTTDRSEPRKVVYVGSENYAWELGNQLIVQSRSGLDYSYIRILHRAPVPTLKDRVHYGSRFKGNHNNMQHRVIRIGDADVIFEDDWVVTWDYLEANYTLLDD